MSEDTVVNTPEESQEVTEQQESAEQQAQVDTQQPETPEWLLPKYKTEGKSIEDAVSEQAKAYKELSSKFGAFTGAPKEYEVSLNEELSELGIEIAKDDPMLLSAMEFAKKSNMSQNGFNEMINLYTMQTIAEAKANEEYKAAQIDALGTNANARLQNIKEWGSAKLDPETYAGLESVLTTAESVKAIEKIIQMAGASPVDADGTVSNSGSSADEVRKMQFEKDAHGNRRINTDPSFKAEYQRKLKEVHGNSEYRVMVG